MDTLIFHNNKKIGIMNKEKGYYISFRTDEHYFKIFDGWGLSEKVLDKLISEGISLILINYKNQKIYHTNIDFFISRGEEYNDKGDKQLILPIKYWMTEINKEKQCTIWT